MTTTLETTQSVARNAKDLESWNDLLFLIEEPDRHGKTVWNIRLKFGSRPPWRYGPYESKGAARKAFASMVKALRSELLDLVCELDSAAECAGNEEF